MGISGSGGGVVAVIVAPVCIGDDGPEPRSEAR